MPDVDLADLTTVKIEKVDKQNLIAMPGKSQTSQENLNYIYKKIKRRSLIFETVTWHSINFEH